MYPENNTPPLFNKRLKVLAIAVAILALCCIGYAVFRGLQFRTVSTDPVLANVGADAPYIKVLFSKELSPTGLSVHSPEQNLIYSVNVKNKTLTVNLKTLVAKHMYSIDIQSIAATDGKQLHSIQLSFVPKNIPFNQLPKDEQKTIIGAQDNYPLALKNPILAYLPYSTLYFILNSSFNKQGDLVLRAQILLAPGVTGTAASEDTTQYEQEVTQYIRSLRLNPSNYTIQYQVVNESLTGV